jgi:hypothetical protein
MTEIENKRLLGIIQTHYQFLKIDQPFIDEWFKYTQKYDFKDVQNKFQEHLVGDYKDKAPNVAYLVKYLKPINEKNKEIYVRCNLCGKEMSLHNFEPHYQRENSVWFMNKARMEFFGKPIDTEKYMTMSQNEFDEKYEFLLETIKDKVSNEKFYGYSQKDIIENILKPIDFED